MSNEGDPVVVEDDRAALVDGAEQPPPRGSGRHTARTVIASVLGVLAVLLLVVAVVGVWAKATVLRSERVAELVGDAVAEPEVQTALAKLLADEAQEAVNLEDRIGSLLPSSLDRFAAPIAAGANAAVERTLERTLASPRTQQAITTLVEKAHARALRLLEGDGLADGVNVADGQVTINLLPLVANGLTALQSMGLLSNVTIPELTADGNPDQQRAELSAALGRDLPPGFAQLVVYESDSVDSAQSAVETAQRILVISQRALWLVIILAVVLIAATILVAARRLRATMVLALGAAGALVLARSAVREVVSQAGDLARTPGGKAATNAIVGGAGDSLIRLAGLLLLVSLVVVAAIVLYRRRWRDDLVLVAAVLIGVTTVAVLGVNVWGLVIGLVIGVAIPFVARVALPARGRRPAAEEPTAPTAPPDAPPPTVAAS
jgi:hypothetical protein